MTAEDMQENNNNNNNVVTDELSHHRQANLPAIRAKILALSEGIKQYHMLARIPLLSKIFIKRAERNEANIQMLQAIQELTIQKEMQVTIMDILKGELQNKLYQTSIAAIKQDMQNFTKKNPNAFINTDMILHFLESIQNKSMSREALDALQHKFSSLNANDSPQIQHSSFSDTSSYHTYKDDSDDEIEAMESIMPCSSSRILNMFYYTEDRSRSGTQDNANAEQVPYRYTALYCSNDSSNSNSSDVNNNNNDDNYVSKSSFRPGFNDSEE